jgi:hypothetical protein
VCSHRRGRSPVLDRHGCPGLDARGGPRSGSQAAAASLRAHSAPTPDCPLMNACSTCGAVKAAARLRSAPRFLCFAGPYQRRCDPWDDIDPQASKATLPLSAHGQQIKKQRSAHRNHAGLVGGWPSLRLDNQLHHRHSIVNLDRTLDFSHKRTPSHTASQHHDSQQLDSCHRIPCPYSLVAANKLHQRSTHMWRGMIDITHTSSDGLINANRTNVSLTATLTAAHLGTWSVYATWPNPKSTATSKPCSHAWTVNQARKLAR